MTDEDLFAQLEGVFDGVEDDVEDLTLLDSPTLVERISFLTQQLLAMGEGLHPTTQTARDAHSERNACQVELRRRGIQV